MDRMESAIADTGAVQRLLPERGVLQISGDDTEAFLQGLITNDVEKVTANQAIYAALLTPQGKYLFDFFIVRDSDALLLDCEAARLPELQKRLNFYKLRSAVSVADLSAERTVTAALGSDAIAALGLPETAGAACAIPGGVAFVDPRLAEMGARCITASAQASVSDDAYERLRLELGLSDGARDIAVEKYFLLEANFDALNGVDFDKGCYVGQELVSRMKHRSAVKKRIIPVTIDGEPEAPGTPVLAGGREAGKLLTRCGPHALAYLRLEALGGDLTAGKARLTPRIPAWLATVMPDIPN